MTRAGKRKMFRGRGWGREIRDQGRGVDVISGEGVGVEIGEVGSGGNCRGGGGL